MDSELYSGIAKKEETNATTIIVNTDVISIWVSIISAIAATTYIQQFSNSSNIRIAKVTIIAANQSVDVVNIAAKSSS